MAMKVLGFVIVATSGCRQVFGLDEPGAQSIDATDSSADSSAGRDCMPAWLDGSIAFGSPIQIAELASSGTDRDPFLSADEKTIYFSSNRTGSIGPTATDVWVASRMDTSSPFQAPVVALTINTVYAESKVSMTADQLLLVVASDRPGTGGVDIWEATRGAVDMPWSALDQISLGAVNSTGNDFDPEISPDGLRLYDAPVIGTGQHIVVSARASRTTAFGAPANVFSFSALDSDPALSRDERVIVFASSRSGGVGQTDLWYATRSTATVPLSAPALVRGINSTAYDSDPALTRSGCRLYFSSVRGGNYDLYVADAF
jgi:hypothetical protein